MMLKPEMFLPTLSWVWPFFGINQAYNCFFELYLVKGISSQDSFRGIAEFSMFSLQAFPSYRPLTKVWGDEPNAARDRVKE